MCGTMDIILKSAALNEELKVLEWQFALVRTSFDECDGQCKCIKYMKVKTDLERQLFKLLGGTASDDDSSDA